MCWSFMENFRGWMHLPAGFLSVIFSFTPCFRRWPRPDIYRDRTDFGRVLPFSPTSTFPGDDSVLPGPPPQQQ